MQTCTHERICSLIVVTKLLECMFECTYIEIIGISRVNIRCEKLKEEKAIVNELDLAFNYPQNKVCDKYFAGENPMANNLNIQQAYFYKYLEYFSMGENQPNLFNTQRKRCNLGCFAVLSHIFRSNISICLRRKPMCSTFMALTDPNFNKKDRAQNESSKRNM